jgi:hypothetical protein
VNNMALKEVDRFSTFDKNEFWLYWHKKVRLGLWIRFEEMTEKNDSVNELERISLGEQQSSV